MRKHRKGRQAHRTSPNARRSKSANTSKHWIWLMTGMLMGILGITAIFLFVTGKWPIDKFSPTPLIRQSNTLASNTSNTVSKKSAQKPKRITQARKKEPARFEFYQLLPGMEVPLPEPATETALNNAITKPTLAKTETKLAAAQYLIQAGTFRALSNAESLKKRLYLKGMSAKIQKIDAEDGIWFRVTLGPFSSETIALSQKSRLAKEKIPGILILQRQ